VRSSESKRIDESATRRIAILRCCFFAIISGAVFLQHTDPRHSTVNHHDAEPLFCGFFMMMLLHFRIQRRHYRFMSPRRPSANVSVIFDMLMLNTRRSRTSSPENPCARRCDFSFERRWRAATPGLRLTLLPLFCCSLIYMLIYILFFHDACL